jgi:phage-related protein
MRELGIVTENGSNRFFDAEGNVKSMAEVMDILNSATSDLTAQQKINALQTIFGTESLAAANVMAGQTAESFGALQAEIGKVKAADVAAEKMNNLAGAVEEFKGSIETAMIRAGAPFQEGLKGIVQGLTGVVNAFSNLSPEVQKYIGYAVAATGVAALLVGGLLLAQNAIASLRAAVLLLNSAFLTNPIFLVIAALVALGVAVYAAYQRFPAFREAVDNLWAGIQPVFDLIRGKIGEIATYISGTAIPAIVGAFQLLVDWFNASGLPRLGEVFTTTIMPAMAGFLEWFQVTFGPGLVAAGTLASTGLQTAFAAMSEGITTGAFVETLTNLGNTIITVFTTVSTFLATVVLPAVMAFVTGAIAQLSLFGAWVQTTFGPLVSAIADLFAAVWTRIQEGIGPFLAFLQGVLIAFVAVAVVLWQTFGDDLVRIIQVAWDFIKGIVEAAVQIITGIIQVATGIISGDWSKLWEGVKNILQGAWNAITAIVTTAVELLFNILRMAIGTIGQILNLGWQGIRAAAEAAWGALVNAITSKFREVTAPVQGVIDTVKSILSIDLSGIGRNLIQGFVNGIKSGLGSVTSAVSSIAEAIPGPIKSFLGIRSPSRLMEGLADDTMAGFLRGLEHGIGSVSKLVATVAPTVVNSILPTDTALPSPAASTGGAVNIVFNYSGSDPEGFVKTVNNSNMIDRITQAARARR